MGEQRDLFDELFALLSPERVLDDPRATGEGIPVCILDSGVDETTLRTRATERGAEINTIQGGIFQPNRKEPLPYTGKHSSPHGTTVADIVLTLAPQVQLYSADIFGPLGTCEVETVINALHWAIHEWKCKVINLSLGVTENKLAQIPRRYQFLRAIEEAYFHDVIIVAAAHNDHPFTRSYPAMFAPPLISVDKHIFESPLQFSYALREHVEFLAHSRGYTGPFAQEPATSWAAPHLSGIAAKLLSLRPTLKPFEIKTLFTWLAQATEK
ncbi:MAG: S8 family serine peptidase [Gemmataceae bacterium]